MFPGDSVMYSRGNAAFSRDVAVRIGETFKMRYRGVGELWPCAEITWQLFTPSRLDQ